MSLEEYLHEVHSNYECDPCQKIFDWKGDLERHVKNVHETNPDYEYDPWHT